MNDANIIARLLVAEHRPTDSEPQGQTELHVLVTENGIHFSFHGSQESATSELIPWRALAQDVIRQDPNLFGDLSEPWHDGFRRGMVELGFHVPNRSPTEKSTGFPSG